MTTINKTVFSSYQNILIQQLAMSSARSVSTVESASAVSTSIAAQNPDGAHSLTSSLLGKWNDTRQSIDRWGNITREINQSKKAFAAEMLKRIKEQIRMLMMLSGGDPKVRARQIAILARELAAAVREYASASGDAGQTSATAQDSNGAAVSPADAADAADATGGATAAAEQPTPADSATATATPAAAFQPLSAHAANEQLGNRISEYSRTTSESDSASQEDREFAMEVRKLAAQLKALAKLNEVRSPKDNNRSTKRETSATEEALREVEQRLSNMDTPHTAASPSFSIVAG